MGLLAAALAILVLQGPPGSQQSRAAIGCEQSRLEQVGQDDPPRQDSPQQPAQQPLPLPAKPDSTAAGDLFSVERLREDLARKQTITFPAPDPNALRFKVEIEGRRWELPDLQQRLARAIPKMAVQVPFGGTTAADMARLNTPPQFMGSSGMTNLEVLQLGAFAAETWLGKAAIRKALEARHNAELAQAREQVRQELAEVEAHNARVAAGLSDDGTSDTKKTTNKKKANDPKKSNDPKKTDKTKQDEKKKKKKDPGSSQ